MIYCVIPRELESELFERMQSYYRDNDGVEVIVDRRFGGTNDRRRGANAVNHDDRRITRDRRRPRAAGTIPRNEAFS